MEHLDLPISKETPYLTLFCSSHHSVFLLLMAKSIKYAVFPVPLPSHLLRPGSYLMTRFLTLVSSGSIQYPPSILKILFLLIFIFK